MKRFETLDAFRGIAALGVILVHYTFGYRVHYGQLFSEKYDFQYGYLGVQFFFIISGFVIFLTLDYSRSAIDFLYRRFSRLYPIFWTCMLTTFLVVHSLGLPGRERKFYNLKGNFTMIPSVFGYTPIDGAYWSLVPEFFFYLAMAGLFICKNKKAYFIWGLSIIAMSWVNRFIFPFPLLAQTILNIQWGSLFFSGILFYKLRQRDYQSKYLIHLLLVIALCTTLINLKTITEQIIVSLLYAVFYLFATGKIDTIKWGPLLFIGKISFPLYLLHQNIGYVMMNYTKPYLGAYPIFFIALPIATLIFGAYLFHRFIELPSINLLRSAWKKSGRGLNLERK